MSSSTVSSSSQTGFFCNNCSMNFDTRQARAQHVQESQFHPKCRTCKVRFPDYISYITHLEHSPRHNYCVACEKDFRTAAGLHVHFHVDPIHRDDEYEDDDSDDEDAVDGTHQHLHEALPDGWEDSYGEYVYPEANEHVKDVLENGSGDAHCVDSWPDDEDEGFEDGSVNDWRETSPVPKQDERSEALLHIVLHNKEHDVIIEKLARRFGKLQSHDPSQVAQSSSANS